jgi:hypothetical protein
LKQIPLNIARDLITATFVVQSNFYGRAKTLQGDEHSRLARAGVKRLWEVPWI